MLGWMSLIFIMSGRQSSQLPNLGLYDWFFKKGAHLTAYAILMLLALWAVRDWRLALAITIGYAISDEYHQTFVPTRQGTAGDVLIDSAGAILALLGVRWWQGKSNSG
jgi:VanZ family protein